MTSFLAFTIAGIVTGCIYAVAASGLVVTYTTSGIFNFAHGAMGMVMAFAYWELRVNRHWPAPLALIAVLLILAPLFGAVIERLLFRKLQGSATGTSLVVTLGLLLALVGVAYTIWDPSEPRSLPEFFAGNSVRIARVNVTWHELAVVGVAGAVAIFLRLLFYRTRTGIAMRAVVDDRDLAALNGAPPARIGQLSWALGTMLAALSGILLAPKLQLEVLILTFLVVAGYAAAMVGRLRSLPLTFAGALALGLGESYAVGYLPSSGWLSRIKPTLPTFMLFAVLIVLPQARLRVGRVVGVKSPRVPSGREAAIVAAVFVAAAFFVSDHLSGSNLNTAGTGLAFSFIMLSLVLLTGYGGQVSLCQLTFVGIGAIVMGRWFGGDSILGLLCAGVVAAPVGALIALPALRLRDLYLALSTLAFAILADNLFFLNVLGGSGGNQKVGRLDLGFMDFRSDRSYVVLLALCFALMGMFVLWLRRGPFGRLLKAMDDSPAACATLGLDQTRTKVAVFAISAAMAGMGGALFGGFRTTVGGNDFIYIQSLVLLLALTINGVSTVSGALLGGMLLALFPVIQEHVTSIRNLQYLATGLGAITVARSPNGVVGQLSAIADQVRARLGRRTSDDAGDVGFAPGEVESVAAA